ALAELRPLARAGDAAAQFYLGTAYADGLAVPRNYALAARWYESAALGGNADAAFALGFLYLNGPGTAAEYALAADPEQAALWLARAADAGHAWARTLLAQLYRDGRGVPADSDRARSLFLAAAAQGIAEAQFSAGLILAGDDATPGHLMDAYVWFRLAALAGYPAAADNLHRLAATFSDAEVAAAEARVRAFVPLPVSP
ncbi:MAG: tetratricopeptide repeat protein, partial [Alphaproteobacteria bacterium]